MSSKRGGLGRNLSALLGHSGTELLQRPAKESLLVLSVEDLQAGRYQPRADFDETALLELAASIQQQGLLQPLVVRSLETGKYEIIAGERRFRACKIAGIDEIPVVLRQVDDETAMAMALVENLQREDLNAAEQARAMARLINEFDLTHQQVAQLLGKSRTTVSNFLRLLSLSEVVMLMLERGDIDMGHARSLLPLPLTQQEELASTIIARQLSVRETEQWVKRLQHNKNSSTDANKPIALSEALLSQSKVLSEQLKTPVRIKSQNNGKGAVEIRFDSPQKLEQILKIFIE